MSKLNIAILGCGNIAKPYVDDLKHYENLAIIGVFDQDSAKLAQFAADNQLNAYESFGSLLADEALHVVVNLSSHHVHYNLTKQALEAGKHVYSEKPLAMKTSEAWELVQLAESQGLRLACSPFVTVGEAQQTAWKYLRDGKLGQVRMVYAEVNWGRIESWHPAPQGFYEVGALFDVGVYLLSLITTMLAPVRKVWSYGQILLPERQTKDGIPYHLTTPDWAVTMLELANGTQVRLTSNFYVSNNSTRQTGLEFHGDTASMHLESMFMFNSPLYYAPFGEKLEPLELVREPYQGIPWGCGVHELVSAVLEQRPQRFTGAQAAHLVEVINAAHESMRTGQSIAIESQFVADEPLDWAR